MKSLNQLQKTVLLITPTGHYTCSSHQCQPG